MITRIIIVAALVALAGCASTDQRPIEERMKHRVVFTISNELPSQPGLLTSYSHASYSDLEPVLVRERSRALVESVLRFHRLKRINQWSIKALGVEAVVAEFRSKRTLDEVIADLSSDDRVDTVQAVKPYKLLTYNDPYFELQSAVRSDDIEGIHQLATGKDVVVGIVDTGLDRQHPEIRERILYSRNHVAHDPARFDHDEHGTAVAGIIASSANNRLGIVGVAPDVKIMAFKACWEQPGTRHAMCDSASLIRALSDAINQQPDILNLSLAGPSDLLIRRLLQTASERGMVLVAAMDNEATESFPAAMPEVIAVGLPLDGAMSADNLGILAPGTDVLTTTPGASYAFKSGSSMATAYVSGIAALMKERQPTLSGEQIRIHLRNTASEKLGATPVVDICSAVRRPGESCRDESLVMVTEDLPGGADKQ